MHFTSFSYKTKQFFVVLIKISLIAACGYFIYHKLTQNEALDFSTFVQFTSKNGVFKLKTVFFLLFLSVLNWGFEILKWQYLANTVTRISYKHALMQSLGALTASLFTPNRIGEYGAKAMYYHSALRKRVMLANAVGHTMQMGITLVFGIIGLVYVVKHFNMVLNYTKLSQFVCISLVIIMILFIVIQYNLINIKSLIGRLTTLITAFPKQVLKASVILSMLRYMTFSFQLFFILHIFHNESPYLTTMCCITSMYLLASAIPSIFIFDLVIKGSVAVYVFSFLQITPLTSLSAMTLMWLLNFAIPAGLGGIYVLNYKRPTLD